MSLHYLNGILTQNETINKINKNAFKKGIKQMRKPEFNTPYTMNSYDVNDCLFYPPTKKEVAVNGWFEDAVNNVTSTVSTAFTNVQQTLSTGVQNVISTTQQALNTIQSQGATAIQNVTNTIQQGLQNVQLPQQFKDNLNALWSQIQSNVGKYGKKIALQPFRTAFLVVVSANAFRLGTNLANAWNKDKNKITNWWVNDWGGDINILKQAINRSSNIALSGMYRNASLGEPVTIATVTAAITSATAVIASVAGVLKSLGVSVQEIESGIKNIIPSKNAPTVTATSPSVERLPDASNTYPTENQLTPGTTDKTLLYVGLGGALLVGGYLLMKKKK